VAPSGAIAFDVGMIHLDCDFSENKVCVQVFTPIYGITGSGSAADALGHERNETYAIA
jgi:hypothetical protein